VSVRLPCTLELSQLLYAAPGHAFVCIISGLSAILTGACGLPRSWHYSERSKRRTLQKDDIQTAITQTETFDFLEDVIK
jgi:hypothetical protein